MATALFGTPLILNCANVLVFIGGLLNPEDNTYHNLSLLASLISPNPKVRQGRRPIAGNVQVNFDCPSVGKPMRLVSSGHGN